MTLLKSLQKTDLITLAVITGLFIATFLSVLISRV